MPTLPQISVLVAARNEEDNILELLESLEKLSYPKDKLQILIGDDASTDRTASIIKDFIDQKPHYQLVGIVGSVANLKGKANVLAQLAHLATGKYFFYTDADIEVPPHWVEQMLGLFDTKKQTHETGVVVGITLVKSTTWFEACQAIEWLFALKIMDNMAKLRLPTTGMGNNMAVLAKAYWDVGGYEKIGFSIVEDYAIFKAIIDKGYGFEQGFSRELMTVTKPPKNYFEQRKRWVSGGMSSKSLLIVPALLQGFALPLLILLGFFDYRIPIVVLIANLLINWLVGFQIFKKLRVGYLLKYIPIYTFYMYIFWFLQLVSYALPTKLVWKGRSY